MKIRDYDIKPETFLKGLILTNGIEFSPAALLFADVQNAKRQNLVYNMPENTMEFRPQEIFLKSNEDDYTVVASCVTASNKRQPILLDVYNNELSAFYNGQKIDLVKIDYVPEPGYYAKKCRDGSCVKEYVTACGYDELNIIPWSGCAVSKTCLFCGVNSFLDNNKISAFSLSKHYQEFKDIKLKKYLANLRESVSIALLDMCYQHHAHIIIVAGNLKDDMLNDQACICGKIASSIRSLIERQSAEGIVLVITPPQDSDILFQIKENGIAKTVFNLEAGTKQAFEKYCPGKHHLGYQYFVDRLLKSVDVFGKGNSWTNFVYGLESNLDLLKVCNELALCGIVPSANILHLDKGNRLDCQPPEFADTFQFFFELDRINRRFGYTPYYCSLALRTSLSNEVYDGRIKEY